MLASLQLPGLLCFGGGFLSLIVPFLVSFFDATLMVGSSSPRDGCGELVRATRAGNVQFWELTCHVANERLLSTPRGRRWRLKKESGPS